MSEAKTPYRNPLKRDGASQKDRCLDALLPEYVKVDERTRNDLICFTREYAKLIQYYNEDNHRKSSWDALFNEKTTPDQPHYALYLAFIWLLRYAQKDINTLTQRHLDYYYREILQLQSKKAKADRVHILFKLAKNVSNRLVKKGTLLKAGKDQLGKELFYTTDKDLVVNKSSATSFKTIFIEPHMDKEGVIQKVQGHGIYASPIANSIDGLGTDIDAKGLTWKGFGQSQIGKKEAQGGTLMPKADIGFAIASPLFYLKEGKREIRITLTHEGNITASFVTYFFGNVLNTAQFSTHEAELLKLHLTTHTTETSSEVEAILQKVKEEIEAKSSTLHRKVEEALGQTYTNEKYVVKALEIQMELELKNAFAVYLSGEKGWIGPLVLDGKVVSTRQITITVELSHEHPAVTAYRQEILGENYSTKKPLIKVLLSKEMPERSNGAFCYHFLRELKLMAIGGRVEVSGVKNLILQNDTANLDPNKPFLPFGPQPALNANLYIGSEEAFQKKLDWLTLSYRWSEVPSDLANHYKVYNDAFEGESGPKNTHENAVEVDESDEKGEGICNASFTTTLELFHKLNWETLVSSVDGQSVDEFPLFDKDDAQKERVVKTKPVRAKLDQYDRATNYQRITQYDNSTLTGFARLRLTGAKKGANGPRGEFQAFGHQWYPRLYTQSVIADEKDQNGKVILPNEPYTPLMESISLDYVSTFFENVSKLGESLEEYFHITPFGHYQVKPKGKICSTINTMMDEGTLYIGLKEVQAPQNVALLFQVSEKSVDHDFVGKVQIKWSYLKDNAWVPLTDKQILSDDTDLLTRSGIIKFDLPKDITKDNTVLPKGEYWLRATAAANTLGIADIISIDAQAVTATYVGRDNDPNHLATSLAEESVKKLHVSDAAIKSLSQPYPSFGGKLAETDANFYTRVSERLRHKRRAVTIWDYERLILDAFPSIHKVKCLNHTYFPAGDKPKCNTEMTPGAVTVIVVPKVDALAGLKNQLEPVANVITINEIKKHLEAVAPPFVGLRQKLVVRNPAYERVKIKCSVKFKPGYDVGYHLQEVNNAAVRYLSPWADDLDRGSAFERTIHKSSVINFLEELPYVEFVCCFELYHLIGNETNVVDLDVIQPSHTAAVLISALNHRINHVEGDRCDCSEQAPETPPRPTQGIGVMIVGIDFLVSKEQKQDES